MQQISLSDGGLMTGIFLRTRFQLENEYVFRPKYDPDKPPPVEPGDIYIVLSAAIGAVVLGSTSLLVSYLAGIDTPYYSVATGAVIGGIAGSFFGDWLKKRVARRRLKLWKKIYDKLEEKPPASK